MPAATAEASPGTIRVVDKMTGRPVDAVVTGVEAPSFSYRAGGNRYGAIPPLLYLGEALSVDFMPAWRMIVPLIDTHMLSVSLDDPGAQSVPLSGPVEYDWSLIRDSSDAAVMRMVAKIADSPVQAKMLKLGLWSAQWAEGRVSVDDLEPQAEEKPPATRIQQMKAHTFAEAQKAASQAADVIAGVLREAGWKVQEERDLPRGTVVTPRGNYVETENRMVATFAGHRLDLWTIGSSDGNAVIAGARLPEADWLRLTRVLPSWVGFGGRGWIFFDTVDAARLAAAIDGLVTALVPAE